MEKQELIFGYNGIVSMSNFSTLAEKQKPWLQETLILTVFEIKSLAATEVPFSSSMAKCNTLTVSCWALKLNGAWQDFDILRVMAHKKIDGSTALLDLDFIFMFRVIDFRNEDQNSDSDSTLFQSDCKILCVCRMTFAYQVVPLFIKPTGRGELIFKELALEGVDGFW